MVHCRFADGKEEARYIRFKQQDLHRVWFWGATIATACLSVWLSSYCRGGWCRQALTTLGPTWRMTVAWYVGGNVLYVSLLWAATIGMWLRRQRGSARMSVADAARLSVAEEFPDSARSTSTAATARAQEEPHSAAAAADERIPRLPDAVALSTSVLIWIVNACTPERLMRLLADARWAEQVELARAAGAYELGACHGFCAAADGSLAEHGGGCHFRNTEVQVALMLVMDMVAKAIFCRVSPVLYLVFMHLAAAWYLAMRRRAASDPRPADCLSREPSPSRAEAGSATHAFAPRPGAARSATWTAASGRSGSTAPSCTP